MIWEWGFIEGAFREFCDDEELWLIAKAGTKVRNLGFGLRWKADIDECLRLGACNGD